MADNYFDPSGDVDREWTFFTIEEKSVRVEYAAEKFPNIEIRVELSNAYYTYKRKCENIWWILSFTGGFFS